MPSLPPPCPKSPPAYPDLYGKRRETAKVQMLEREIGFLQEELKSAERIQPASRCCKEVADFIVANPDPLMPTNRRKRRSCRCWKWLCVNAVLVIVVVVNARRVSVARYQNGVALVVHVRVPDQIAVKRSHATEVVAAYSLLLVVHALIAHLADANANANALVLHVYRLLKTLLKSRATGQISGPYSRLIPLF
uniref:G protein gamma domain-containing protein n=1 Tax=Cannabis sativa TaxID=3483 RepID=A0A803NS29_CANSA